MYSYRIRRYDGSQYNSSSPLQILPTLILYPSIVATGYINLLQAWRGLRDVANGLTRYLVSDWLGSGVSSSCDILFRLAVACIRLTL